MVEITKSEKEEIQKRFPNIHIVRTEKRRSHRHHYWCEETQKAMRYLRELRGEIVPEKGGAPRGSVKKEK